MLRLAAMGFRDGLTFEGFAGEQQLFFRLPAGVPTGALRLVLPYRGFATGPVRRTLTVTSGSRMLGQFPLAAGGTLELPIPADAVEGGALAVTLSYDGGISANRCFDARMTGDRLQIAADGGLALGLAGGAPLSIAAAVAMLPTRPTILVDPRPDPAEAAAALSVIAARGGGTIVTAARPGAVRIDGGTTAALTAGPAGSATALAIGGRDPAAAARAAFGEDGALLAAASVDRLSLRRHRRDALTFAALGADTSLRQLPAGGGWNFAVPASRLPAGTEIAGIALDLAAAPGGPGDSVAVSLNGNLLGSAPLPRAGRARLHFAVPRNVTHSINGVSVTLHRARADDCGSRPRAWPAQLLGTSELLVRDAGKADDFSDFAARTRDGVTVVMPGPAQLPLAARAVAGLVGGGVPIRVSYGAIPAEGPAIVIAAAPPPGMTPALATRDGRLTLAAREGELDLDLPATPEMTVAQLAEADGRALLWIRPGTTTPANMWLDQGDVALVAPNGVVNALSTTRPALAARAAPPPARHWWQGLGWGWLAIAGIVIGIVVVSWSLMPSVKKLRPGQAAE